MTRCATSASSPRSPLPPFRLKGSPLKKIAFFTTHLPPDDHYGGVVATSAALLAAHARAGFDVTAFCVGRAGAPVSTPSSARVFKSPTLFFHRWGWAPRLRRTIRENLDSPDLAYVNGILTFPATLAARELRARRVPCVVATRGGMRRNALSRGHLRKALFFRLWTIPSLRNSACIHATSLAEADDYRLFDLRSPVVIVPNGIDPHPFLFPADHPPIEELLPTLAGRRLVLFMGRLSPEKNLETLLHAWKIAGPKCDNAVLVIAGPDDRRYLARLRSCARSLDLPDVLFPGMLRGGWKLAIYRRADLLVLPSLTESFGNVVLEALASGVPVLASDATPWKILDEIDAGCSVPPRAAPLADALASLLALSPAKLHNMGERGRALVLRDYTWDIVVRKLMTVYDCVLAGKVPSLFPDPFPDRDS
ncbi:MAG: glycosyltransferase [Planctomycetota bacterium]